MTEVYLDLITSVVKGIKFFYEIVKTNCKETEKTVSKIRLKALVRQEVRLDNSLDNILRPIFHRSNNLLVLKFHGVPHDASNDVEYRLIFRCDDIKVTGYRIEIHTFI